jgi:hypothetical protein
MYFIGYNEKRIKLKPLIFDKWTENDPLPLGNMGLEIESGGFATETKICIVLQTKCFFPIDILKFGADLVPLPKYYKQSLITHNNITSFNGTIKSINEKDVILTEKKETWVDLVNTYLKLN